MAVGPCLPDPAPDQRLDGQKRTSQQDKHRDNRGKQRRRAVQQQDGATDTADQRSGGEQQQPPALPSQVGPLRQGPAQIAGTERHCAGQVGNNRRHPKGDHRRKGDQRSAPGQRVHRTRDEARQHEQRQLCQIVDDKHSRAGVDPDQVAAIMPAGTFKFA